MRWTIALVPLLTLSTLALAEPPPEPQQGAQPQQVWKHLLERFDRNGDGALTQEDFQGPRGGQFRNVQRPPQAPGAPQAKGRGRGQARRARPQQQGPEARQRWQANIREWLKDKPELRRLLQQRVRQQRMQGQMQGRGRMGMGPMQGPGRMGMGPMQGHRGPGMQGQARQQMRGRPCCPMCGQECGPRAMRGPGRQQGRHPGPPRWAQQRWQ